MDIKLISQERAEDLNMPNEVFELFGKLNVQRLDRQWDYSIHYFEESKWEVFPDEAYDWQQVMTQGFALGAYVDEQLLGLAIFQDDWKKFMYLHDLSSTLFLISSFFIDGMINPFEEIIPDIIVRFSEKYNEIGSIWTPNEGFGSISSV